MRELEHKTMVAVTGGALALLITFLGNILGTKNIHAPIYLFWAWGCLALSLAVAVAELMLGIHVRKQVIKEIAQGQKKDPGGKLVNLLEKIRYIPFLLLAGGFVIMGRFFYLISREFSM